MYAHTSTSRLLSISYHLSPHKAAVMNVLHVVLRHTAACVALVVSIQTNNVMKVVRGQIQHITRLKHDLVDLGIAKLGKPVKIGIGPVHFGMPRRGMTNGI